MRKSRFTEELIIGFLKQAEAGMPVKDLCRKEGFSDDTFYKWRAKFGGMAPGLQRGAAAPPLPAHAPNPVRRSPSAADR